VIFPQEPPFDFDADVRKTPACSAEIAFGATIGLGGTTPPVHEETGVVVIANPFSRKFKIYDATPGS
jgi:hypothetical protein